MKYSAQTSTPHEVKTPCLVTSLSGAERALTRAADRTQLEQATTDFDNSVGKVISVVLGKGARVQRVLVIGGCDSEIGQAQFRKAATAAAAALVQLPVSSAVWALHQENVEGSDVYWRASTSLQAVSLAAYQYQKHKSKKAPSQKISRVSVLADGRSRTTCARAVKEANALKAGLDFARDLGNEPPNVCNPTYLLKEARKLGRADKVRVSALDEKKMAELGMGSFLSVSQGSDTPGKLIIVQYNGGKRGEAPVVLVGKGITFDTGGISLKPGPAMDEMKFDMCGAATVLGATKAAIEAKLPLNLITLVAAAENMPSGKASRPGDIVTSLSGQTIEILNTDAEGRLVLCDALEYARRYKPKTVIDVATLTGACIIALGSHASALYANDDELADDILEAGTWSGDRSWRMPLWDDYQNQLKSNFADMQNIGGREAGSITAACFLARFTKDLKWAHMDVAGSAFHGGARKGASGRPVPSLFRYLINQC